jgi:hypothetical protein
VVELQPAGNDVRQTESEAAFTMTTHLGGSFTKLQGKGGPQGGGVRSRITGFSRGSRQRLQRKLASINEGEVERQRWFVTLTYPGQYPACGRQWKRDLDTFIKRLQRAFAVQAVVWKLEPQKRGAPHYHLLVFSQDTLEREWVANAWYEVVGSGRSEHLYAGTQCDEIRSWRGVLFYASKYLGKVVVGDGLPAFWETAGRWWGVRGKLPIQEIVEELSRQEGEKFRRVVRKLIKRRCGYRIKQWGTSAGIACFMSDVDACRLLVWAVNACDDGRRPDAPRPRDALDVDLAALPY